jgi:hypothetical protein
VSRNGQDLTPCVAISTSSTSFFPSIGAVNPALAAMANGCALAITSRSD